MDRRTATRVVASNVREAARTEGDPEEVVAKATGLTANEVRSRLDGSSDFELAELVSVGGLLRVSASSFLEGVA